ncbi:MAG: nucleotide-diphospho-sugar transferase [Flavobacteriaceae bacterium]
MIFTPVLLIAFNRPKTTLIVFDRIRKAQPKKLFIALDGPRNNKEGEREACSKVQSIIENIDWDCEVHYKINISNKGAEITVSSAISWVFETEEYVIILEDDIVAPIAFFEFAQEMLIKYKNDDQIGTITSNNFTPLELSNNNNNKDYFFAKYGHSWGWATWRRVWNDFDLNAEISEEHLTLSFLKTITNSNKEARYYQKLFKKMKERGVGQNTWDFMALYQHRIKNRLSIIPRVNLSSNIGVFGLHARGESKFHNLPFDESFKVNHHPQKIECFDAYDKYHFKKHIIGNRIPFYSRVIRKIKRLLK